MIEAAFPLLSLLIVFPMIGAIAVVCCSNSHLVNYLALAIAGLEFLLSLPVVIYFNQEQGQLFQWVECYRWIPSLNIEFLVGVDGIAVWFIPLSTLLTLVSIGAAWNSIIVMPRFYFALLFGLESVTLGIFCALDVMLFFLCWELTLPPLFFLISLWGVGPQRRNAAMKYTLTMLFGGVPLLFAFLLAAMQNSTTFGNGAQKLVFSLPELLSHPLPEHLQGLVFGLLLLGFAVKAPLFPFHTWLPAVAMEGPPHITALLTGLKLGVFGIIRFTLPLAPKAAVEYRGGLSILGVITLLYGALLSLQQSNLRRLLAYASISHVGLVMIGIASLTLEGIQGAMLQLINFTWSASALMLLAGFIQQRFGSTEAIQLGGLAQIMPRLSSVYFIFFLASIGMPGTSGFPAELLLMISALLDHPALGIAALCSSIIGASALFLFTKKAFWGPITDISLLRMHDFRPREMSVLAAFLLLVFGVGWFPEAVLSSTEAAAVNWLHTFATVSTR